MSTTLTPRQVDRPFIGRWLRASASLFLRSPLRFGIAIALLGWADTATNFLAHGVKLPRQALDDLGLAILPIAWLLVCALARGADDPSQAWSALAALTRKRLWLAVGTGIATLVTIMIVIQWTLGGLPALLGAPPAPTIVVRTGDFVDSLTTNVMLVTVAFEPCYLPLLLFGGEPGHSHALYLARKAAKLNEQFLVWVLICVGVISANALARLFPAFGMTESAFLVAVGIFNYVAYRDIFERRAENLPQAVSRSVAMPVSTSPASESPR